MKAFELIEMEELDLFTLVDTSLSSAERKAYLISKTPIRHDHCSWSNWMPRSIQIPSYGWKLHISATVLNAEKVLTMSAAYLIKNKMAFKFASSLEFLSLLNTGKFGDSQAGKFITIYPLTDLEAQKTAFDLDQLLKNFSSQTILSDKPFRPQSLVHYRWGSFIEVTKQTLYGGMVSVIHLDSHKSVLDSRQPFYQSPQDVSNPFHGHSLEKEHWQGIYHNRYLAVKLISRSLNGDVILGLDIIAKRRCIIKLAFRHSLIDAYQRDICDRLDFEAEVLSRLEGIPSVPKLYDIFHDQDENRVLVMEDIEGLTLEDIIILNQCNSSQIEQKAILEFSINFARALIEIHDRGIVHADLKSANIMIDADKNIRIIDFNTAYLSLSAMPRFGGGSIHFNSLELREGALPCILDDIYSFGAILFYYATNGNPSKTGSVDSFDEESMRLKNNKLSLPWINLVFKCLRIHQNKAFSGMHDVMNALENLKSLDPAPSMSFKTRHSKTPLEYSFILGEILLKDYYDPQKPDLGFRTELSPEMALNDLRGTAACVIALAKLYRMNKDDRFKKALFQVSQTLLKNTENLPNTIPGLYVGETGVCLGLLEAGIALKEASFMEASENRFLSLKDFPYESPDLYNGTAGRLKFALMLHQVTQNNVLLEIATEAKNKLLLQQIVNDAGEVYWLQADTTSIPYHATYEEKHQYLGYAHGAAGIADALIDYYQLFPEEAIQKSILGVRNWLIKQSQFVQSKIQWPVKPGEEVTSAFWCHGATGIGHFFLNLAQSNLDTNALNIARQCAISSAEMTWASPIQCHGLAGNIELIIAIYEFTRERKDLKLSQSLVKNFNDWMNKIDHFPWGITEVEARDYMTGLPGFISCYEKLNAIWDLYQTI